MKGVSTAQRPFFWIIETESPTRHPIMAGHFRVHFLQTRTSSYRTTGWPLKSGNWHRYIITMGASDPYLANSPNNVLNGQWIWFRTTWWSLHFPSLWNYSSDFLDVHDHLNMFMFTSEVKLPCKIFLNWGLSVASSRLDSGFASLERTAQLWCYSLLTTFDQWDIISICPVIGDACFEHLTEVSSARPLQCKVTLFLLVVNEYFVQRYFKKKYPILYEMCDLLIYLYQYDS